MLLPIGDDNPTIRTPWVHYGIITLNVLVFLYMLTLPEQTLEAFANAWGFVPAHFNWVSLFTALYIHGGILHIFGNLLFLYIVGDNVEDRMGHLGYFVFYHATGAVGNLAHMGLDPTSAIATVGASGAISGVMGAYAAFYPNAKIRLWYWLGFFFTGRTYISAKWAVGLWFAEQVVLILIFGETGVAYSAHIAGLVFGVLIALILRFTLLREYDVIPRILKPQPGPEASGWGRPEPVPAEAEAEGEPWGETLPQPHVPLPAPAAVRPTSRRGEPEKTDEREGVLRSLRTGDPRAAYDYFTHAVAAHHPDVLDEPTMMLLADALLAAKRYGAAAHVYDVTLHAYPEGRDSPEAAFRLGMILSREFRDYTHARAHLKHAWRDHPDPGRKAQAWDELKRIDSVFRGAAFIPGGGRVWVMRRSEGPADLGEVARLAGEWLGIPASQVSASLRSSHGIIARNVPAMRANSAVRALAAAHVPLVAIPSDRIVIPGAAVTVRTLDLSSEGVRFELASSVVSRAWSDARLISAGGIVGADPRVRPPSRVIDVFFPESETPTHLRVREGAFSFRATRAPGGSGGGFADLVRSIISLAPAVPMNAGMKLADRPVADPAWQALSFPSERDFDQYNTWLLQLVLAFPIEQPQ
jgi:membrane associated rhomboid family serine protease